MLEATLVLTAIGAVGLVILLAALLTAPVLIVGAIGVLFLGLVVGVPTGFWYHVVLYRIVSAKIPGPRSYRCPVDPPLSGVRSCKAAFASPPTCDIHSNVVMQDLTPARRSACVC